MEFLTLHFKTMHSQPTNETKVVCNFRIHLADQEAMLTAATCMFLFVVFSCSSSSNSTTCSLYTVAHFPPPNSIALQLGWLNSQQRTMPKDSWIYYLCYAVHAVHWALRSDHSLLKADALYRAWIETGGFLLRDHGGHCMFCMCRHQHYVPGGFG